MEYEKIMVERPNKIVYKEGDKTVKLFVENYSKANILNEAVNQARIEETGLNVPSLLEVSKIDNRWAITLEYIEGTTLEELMRQHPEREEEYLQLFIQTQNIILNARAPLLSRVKDKMRRKIRETNIINDNTRFELLQLIEGMPTEYCVCHGDFHPSNVIVRDDGEVFVIDWAHVTQGSPIFDAARTYLLFALEGKELLAKKYLQLFADTMNIPMKNILKCVPIVACTQKMKGISEEQAMLEKWIDVVDFM